MAHSFVKTPLMHSPLSLKIKGPAQFMFQPLYFSFHSSPSSLDFSHLGALWSLNMRTFFSYRSMAFAGFSVSKLLHRISLRLTPLVCISDVIFLVRPLIATLKISSQRYHPITLHFLPPSPAYNFFLILVFYILYIDCT